jgi:hypothetical protein
VLQLLAYSFFLEITRKLATPVEGIHSPPSLACHHTPHCSTLHTARHVDVFTSSSAFVHLLFHCCVVLVSFQTAAGNGAKLIVLPEMWNCPYSNDSFPTYAEDIDAGPSPSTDMLSAAAQEFGVTLVGGSVPEKSNGKLYNTCCVFDHQGKLLAKHRQVPGSCQQWTYLHC